MKQLLARTIVFVSVFMLAIMLVPAAVFAHNGESHANTEAAEAHKAELYRGRSSARLDAAKKRVCENRSQNIKAIMARSVARAENQTKLFGNITDRVTAFYEKKGKTVANYAALVAAVDDAKAQVATDITALKAAAEFDCSGDDPKGEAEAFKDAQKAVIASLKEYRTAVKNLIVGVRTAQSQGDTQ